MQISVVLSSCQRFLMVQHHVIKTSRINSAINTSGLLLRESSTRFRVRLSRNNCPEGPGPGFVRSAHTLNSYLLLLQGIKADPGPYLSVQYLI